MKFLCDNCKAKYQIADDKVAGKTVRMKCRKCGHQIEVRAAVPTTSTALLPPGMALEKKPLATALAGRAPMAPRPAVSRSDAPRSEGGSSLANAFQKSVQMQADSLTPAPRLSDAPPLMTDLSVADEWYVAINGVPVGPIRISEIRRKAATGAVTGESLVWQEGLEEWRPVKAVAELAQIVREAAAGARPSLAAPSGGERVSQLPHAPHATGHASASMAAASRRPTAPRAPEPLRPAANQLRSNVVPIGGRLATAERLDEQDMFAPPAAPIPPPPALAADPFAVPGRPGGHAAAAAVADPFAAPPSPQVSQRESNPGAYPMGAPYGAASQVGERASSVGVQIPAQEQRRGAPLWFILVAVFTGCFGVALAVVLFLPKPAQPAAAPVVINMPGPAATTTGEAPPVDPVTVAPVDSSAPAASASGTKVAVAQGGAKPATGGAAPEPSKKTADLSSLLGGAGGPSTGPAGGGGGGGGGGLDAAAVQNVVRNRAPGVKRTCWERGGDGKSSANIAVVVTVAPNGSVSNANATGDDPVVAKCIENQVRGWQFPPPGSTTTVNIPFHFVRQ